MKTHTPKVLAEGIVFGEGPRWHGGKLWFSDMRGKRVMTVTGNGKLESSTRSSRWKRIRRGSAGRPTIGR